MGPPCTHTCTPQRAPPLHSHSESPQSYTCPWPQAPFCCSGGSRDIPPGPWDPVSQHHTGVPSEPQTRGQSAVDTVVAGGVPKAMCRGLCTQLAQRCNTRQTQAQPSTHQQSQTGTRVHTHIHTHVCTRIQSQTHKHIYSVTDTHTRTHTEAQQETHVQARVCTHTHLVAGTRTHEHMYLHRHGLRYLRPHAYSHDIQNLHTCPHTCSQTHRKCTWGYTSGDMLTDPRVHTQGHMGTHSHVHTRT